MEVDIFYQIRQQWILQSEAGYRKFTSSLIPGVDHILGIRMPLLRDTAKSFSIQEKLCYLSHQDVLYFEETMMQGIIIGQIVSDSKSIWNTTEKMKMIAEFLPKIDNWSVCDSFCCGLKWTKKNQNIVWPFLNSYLESYQPFEQRFAIVMMLDFFIDLYYIHLVLEKLAMVKSENYYVKMAVAWALSICYIKIPEAAEELLRSLKLNHEIQNMTIQKIESSYRVTSLQKVKLRYLKIRA